MKTRCISKQLSCLTLAIFTVASTAAAGCPETMQNNLLGACIKDGVSVLSRYGFITRLRLTDLWQLDAGSVHPPLRLPQLKIEQLVMESLWQLRPGESVIGDPRWGDDKRQPNLDAIAFLRARESAIASSKVGKRIKAYIKTTAKR